MRNGRDRIIGVIISIQIPNLAKDIAQIRLPTPANFPLVP